MNSFCILWFVSLVFVAAALKNQSGLVPVVLWHGMGDSCCNPLSLGRIMELIKQNVAGEIYVKSLRIGSNIFEDTENGFFMNVNSQIDDACQQIRSDDNLKGGYNALGFSQGAQFLRALVQRCPDPPMKNLISFGGQHQGIFGIPHCTSPSDKLCEYLRTLLKFGIYKKWVQNRFVQAEFWHDPIKESEYISNSIFLADINNERAMNYTYRKNLMTLNNFVLVKFADDTIVVPKDTSWFGFYTPGQDVNITKLQDSALYIADRIGLKALNEAQKLHFLSVPGNHLHFTEKWFIDEILHPYLV